MSNRPGEHNIHRFSDIEQPLTARPVDIGKRGPKVGSRDPATGYLVVFQGDAAAMAPLELQRTRTEQITQSVLDELIVFDTSDDELKIA